MAGLIIEMTSLTTGSDADETEDKGSCDNTDLTRWVVRDNELICLGPGEEETDNDIQDLDTTALASLLSQDPYNSSHEGYNCRFGLLHGWMASLRDGPFDREVTMQIMSVANNFDWPAIFKAVTKTLVYNLPGRPDHVTSGHLYTPACICDFIGYTRTLLIASLSVWSMIVDRDYTPETCRCNECLPLVYLMAVVRRVGPGREG
ncbi:hypothetical protein BDV27DRAFT_164219 [Aspergillus caelatus]|uniref:Uncharacterized protein n=1 Tax=Aspergillus caelatus TaxID=61420 RepID=A0A5N6ZLS5_9EURO|nr:uncharacterized protein BDV27DRAFT_164219 [Aspergillus caelatus]KAE8357759.1 hypothetical protein BDV27DRAFT_164219 [Aspergillus caelatus]